MLAKLILMLTTGFISGADVVPTYIMYLLKDEFYQIEYSKFSTKLKQMDIVHLPPDNDKSNETQLIQSKNYYFQNYLVFANLSQDCIRLRTLDPTGKFFDNNGQMEVSLWRIAGMKQTLNRNMKLNTERTFVTSSYGQTLFGGPKDPSLNRLETYAFSDVNGILTSSLIALHDNVWTLAQEFDYPSSANPVARVRNQMIKKLCITHQYLYSYKEVVAICVNISYFEEPNNPATRNVRWDYSAYFERMDRGQVLPLRKYSLIDLNPINFNTLTMVIEPTHEFTFEVFIYLRNTTELFTFILTPNEMMQFKTHQFEWPITEINYVASTLILFESEGFNEQNNAIQSKLYFLHRYPGTKMRLSQLELFAESRFLRGHFSSENIEIIIETQKFSSEMYYGPGFFPPITHLMYSYNLITKKMVQISTQIFSTTLSPPWSAHHFRLESLSLLDNIVVNIHTNIYTGFANGALTDRMRFNFLSSMDVFSGFGSVSFFNSTYNLYGTMSIYDTNKDVYMMLPFMTSVVRSQGLQGACSVLRQRVVRPTIVVKYFDDAKNPTTMKTIVRDSFYKKDFARYDFNFIDEVQMEKIYYDIWEGSDQLEYEINANVEKRSIDIDAMVGGSFAIRKFDLGENNGKAVPFLEIALKEAELVTKQSFLDILNARIQGINDMQMQGIEYMFAVERTDENRRVETIFFLKKRGFAFIHLYSLKPNSNLLTELKDIEFMDRIKKVIPLEENLYVFFIEDGSLQLYDARRNVMEPMPFPGVNCIDMEIFYHPKMKPSFVCLSFSYKLTMYYIDEFLHKSLAYSLFRTYFTYEISSFTTESILLTSDFYPGKVFVYTPTPANKGKEPNVLVFYLELEELPQFVSIRNLTLNIPNPKMPSYKHNDYYPVRSLMFADQRLVVFYGDEKVKFWITVYEFDPTNNMEARVMKYYSLKDKFSFPENAKFFKVYKHFQSVAHPNSYKPLLALRFTRDNPQTHNLFIVDPFTPTIETIPTVLLPRDSYCKDLEIFPYYLANANRIRFHSVGLLHYATIKETEVRDPEKLFYLFQLVEPNELRVYLQIDKKKFVSYQSVFQKFQPSAVFNEIFEFESYLSIGNKSVGKLVSKNVTIIQRRSNPRELGSQNISFSQKIDVRTNYTHQVNKIKFGSPEIVLYEERFTDLADSPAISWELRTESIYDYVFGILKLEKPVEFVFSKKLNPTPGLLKVDRFCRTFKYNSHSSPIPVCIKFGWIFFYTSEIELFYFDKITEIDPRRGLRFPFNVDQCIENEVINQMLVTVCIFNQNRFKVITNLIDLSQTYIPMKWVAIYPKFTFPRVTKYHNTSIIQFSKFIVDEKNIVGVSNTYYFSYNTFINLNSAEENCISPFFINCFQIYAFDSKLTDTAVAATYIISNKTLRVSGINLNVGNLVHFQIIQEAYTDLEIMTGRHKRFSFQSLRYVFTINTTQEIKQLAFDKATIHDLVFNSSEYNSYDMTFYFKYALLTFPNYHSYLIRYKTFDRDFISFFKLYNTFSELENEYKNMKPNCHAWACAQISKFENQYFIRVYDMMPERMYKMGEFANFNQTFGNENHTSKEFFENKDGKELQPYFLLDKIPDNYTIFPIEVYNVSGLEAIEFDTHYSNPQREDQLRLLLISRNGSVTGVNVNRKLRFTSSNIYFTSEWADISIKKAYSLTMKIRLNFTNFTEANFYKYVLHAGAVTAFGIFVIFGIYAQLTRLTRASQREVEEEQRALEGTPEELALLNEHKREKLEGPNPIRVESESMIVGDVGKETLLSGEGEFGGGEMESTQKLAPDQQEGRLRYKSMEDGEAII